MLDVIPADGQQFAGHDWRQQLRLGEGRNMRPAPDVRTAERVAGEREEFVTIHHSPIGLSAILVASDFHKRLTC